MTRASAHDLGRSPWPRMSYEEYLADSSIDEYTEWIDGEAVPMMAVTPLHQQLAVYLVRLLGDYAEERELGQVLTEPVNMKTGPDLPGRSPDVFFIRNEHLGQIRPAHVEGPADLVIEVISPGTERIDRVTKFAEYERGGVPEYWILDPQREQADFFVRNAAGSFEKREPDANGIIRSSTVEGFWLRIEWLWKRPPVLAALKEIEGGAVS